MPREDVTREIERCIRECLECHRICLDTAINHQLGIADIQLEPAQIRLLLNCAEICQTTATVVRSGSPLHRPTCRVCAKLCRRCATEFERTEAMRDCAKACRRCAESCQRLSA